VGELEAKLSFQQMATQACELRMHGIPFIDGENLKKRYHKLFAAAHSAAKIYRARKTLRSSGDLVVIIKMDHYHEKITLSRCIGAYRRTAKQQLSFRLTSRALY